MMLIFFPLTCPLQAARPLLLRLPDGPVRRAAEVGRRVFGQRVAGVLAEHLPVLAVAPLLAAGQPHRDVVEVVEPVEKKTVIMTEIALLTTRLVCMWLCREVEDNTVAS